MHDILIIEDEPHLRRTLSIALTAEGFTCLEAASAAEGIVLASKHFPSLVILDLGLPDQDGSAVLARIREMSRVPILILSARDGEKSKVNLLRNGANDYVCKPFGMAELVARVYVLLRDFAPLLEQNQQPRYFQRSFVDPYNKTFRLDGKEIFLTPKEFQMIAVLTEAPGALIAKETLLRRIWGDWHQDDSHYLRILVSQLRRKLGDNSDSPALIETSPGYGYRYLDHQI